MAPPIRDLACSGTIVERDCIEPPAHGARRSARGSDAVRCSVAGGAAAWRGRRGHGAAGVRPMVEAVAERGVEAALEYGETVRRGAARAGSGCPRPAAPGHWPNSTRTSAPRWRWPSNGSARCMPISGAPTAREVVPGGTVIERWVPVARVGLYVPGGNAVYPSSVVMNVVPAQMAGVASLVVASPPQAEFDGLPHPTILPCRGCSAWTRCGRSAERRPWRCLPTAARHRRRGDRGRRMVTGPGNIYVTAAKRICRSEVGIDAEAGPTEIAILADHTADPVHVAADLISQAEHDEMAASVLVTSSGGPRRCHRPGTRRPAGDDGAPRAGDRRADRARSRRSCSSTMSTPVSGW